MAARPYKKAQKKAGYAYIVSACLAGTNCTYNGKNRIKYAIKKLVEKGAALGVCPEMLGGSSIPREICEISGGDGGDVLDKLSKVRTISGKDITKKLVSGAKKTLALVNRYGIKKAVLKSKSPSCGMGVIYDGTFTRKLKKGDGVTTALLRRYGIKVYNERGIGYGR